MARSTTSRRLFIVGIGGGTRPGSSTERALRLALTPVEEDGAEVVVFSGPALDLPIYAPEQLERPEPVRVLVDALRRADGVVIASPAYHGGPSGLIKNALDYAEDLKTDPRPYLDGRAVGCIATAAGWQGIAATLSAMRGIVHALRGWPTPLGVGVNTSEPAFGLDGDCLSPELEARLKFLGGQVLDFARWRAAAEG